jgi:hypothetical protein
MVSQNGPTTYGAFYKDNTNEGFALTLNAIVGSEEGKSNTKSIIDSLIKCSTNMYNDYQKMTKEEKVQEVYECWGLLEQEIKKFNKIAFPNGIRLGKTIDITSELAGIGSVVSTTIDFLTQIGEIKNDNFNGMSFGYNDMKIAS